MSGTLSQGSSDKAATQMEAAASRRATRDRVLIVDDDKIIVDSLRELLRVEGYDVDGVYSVREAADRLARHPYAILITDVNMPEADGFEL
ncbi:MAG: response regulator, partial [Phycisphaerae bacterium]